MADKLRRIRIKRDRVKNIRYYKNIEYPVIQEYPDDIFIVTRSTDRLDLLAFDYYKNSQLWWIISKANPDKIKRDSLFLDPGLQIRIPLDVENIYNDFERLNR